MKLMLNESKLNIELPDLLETIVCDIANEKCMLNFCQQCPGFELLRIMFNNDHIQYTEYVNFKQWVSTDRAALITMTKSYDEFFEYLSEQLIKLKTHHFIAKQQSSYLRAKKESLLETECIVLGDFAENYTFVVQDEIQSYHWVNLQATLHPYTIYYKSTTSNILKTKSFCIISDHLKHNADSVFSFQSRLLQQIKSEFPNVLTIHYFSDGASSQYKNYKNMVNLCYHKSDFGLDAEWNFFATAHGKSPCDGIGGTIKRLVYKASLQRPSNDQILTPQSMYTFCKSNIKGIHFIYVHSNEVNEIENKLVLRYAKANKIPGIRSQHRFIPVNCNTIKSFTISTSSESKSFKII
jgi:hypothetical protein